MGFISNLGANHGEWYVYSNKNNGGTMSELAEQFIEKWHEGVDERSFEKINDLLADGIELISPVAFTPITDRKYILKVLENVVTTIEGFHYTRSTALADGGVLLIFQGKVDGLTIEGIDLFDLDDEGRAIRLKVMLRPYKAYTTFAFKMAERMGIRSFKMKLLKFLVR